MKIINRRFQHPSHSGSRPQVSLTGMALAFLLLSCCWAPLPVSASKAMVPMGSAVRQAALIAVVDTASVEGNWRETILTLREIIKGDPAQQGKQLTLTLTTISSADVRVPRNVTGIVLLFGPNWDANAPAIEPRNIQEIYRTPDEIAALRTLIRVYQLPAEREQLTQLRHLALQQPAPGDTAPQPMTTRTADILRKQLWADLRAMREPDNYPLITELFARSDEEGQRAIIDIIQYIGDTRGVPTLLQAMESPNRGVALSAARALAFHFPDAPGVVAAFRRALQSEMLKATATHYLTRYDTTIRDRVEAERTDYQKVSRLLRAGDEVAARPYFLRILKDQKLTEAIVRFDTGWVVRSIKSHPAQADEVRRALMPVLERYVAEGDYMQAIAAAAILNALPHPDTVPLLLRLLEKKEVTHGTWLFEKSVRIAAFALANRGAATRQAANALDDVADWALLSPILDAAGQPDEAGTLLRQLEAIKQGTAGSRTAVKWMVYRLGELQDKRAIQPLVAGLDNPAWDTATVVEALIRIGGPAVDQAVETLLKSDRSEPRRPALEILYALRGKRILPVLRRLINDKDPGLQSSALLYLGHVGTPDDLKLLQPLADYWAGDRMNHYWVTLAIAEIRDRYTSPAP